MSNMQMICLVSFLLQVSTVTLNLLEASTVFTASGAGRVSTRSIKLISPNFVCSCSSERSEVGKISVSRCQRDNVTKSAITVSGVPRNFVQGGGVFSKISVQDRGQREQRSGGGSPLVRGSAQFANE
jgi:hypothetical protein